MGACWPAAPNQRVLAKRDFSLYGVLDICSGDAYTRAFQKGWADDTVQFLDLLRTQTTGKVLLIWNQASWHTFEEVQEALGCIGRIQTLFLPARTPEVNSIKDLWREVKRQIAACLERPLETLLASARRYFNRLTPAQALRTAGIAG